MTDAPAAMTKEEKLKPCPFCGSKKVTACEHFVFCQACQCDGPMTARDARVAWNRRSPPDALYASEIARLTAALEQAAAWFEEYADGHQAKGALDKASRNLERANFLRRAARSALSPSYEGGSSSERRSPRDLAPRPEALTHPETSANADGLLPCPFCGGEAEINQIGNEYTKSRGFEVKCLTWGCSTKKRAMVIRQSIEKARGFAVDAWNARALPDLAGWERFSLADERFLDPGREVLVRFKVERGSQNDYRGLYYILGDDPHEDPARRAIAILTTRIVAIRRAAPTKAGSPS